MENKGTRRYVDYDKAFQKTVGELGKRKPSLLLHACCGPCSCYPLTELVPHFNVTILYANSNIYPESEFDRRKKELERLLLDLKNDFGYEVKLIEDYYDYENYMGDLRGFSEEKEGNARCKICYRKRLRRGFEVAKENHIEYLTTTLTLSRWKPSQAINEIARDLQAEFPEVTYLHSDFKKRGGIDKGKLIQNKYGLYQQLYCGCEYSYRDALERAEAKGEKEAFLASEGVLDPDISRH